jgi:uncharacterized protein
MSQRALYWQEGATLFVADVHIGKAASFRSLGVPVPSGTTDENLARLSECLAITRANRLVILGDFVHAPSSYTEGVMAALYAWRNQWSDVAVILIQGNHDRRAGAIPIDLKIEVHPREVSLMNRFGPFLALHEPSDSAIPSGQLGLAGHIHPVVRFEGKARDRLRLPCFVLNHQQAPNHLLLPAFGEFTGGYALEKKDCEKLFVVGPRVLAI